MLYEIYAVIALVFFALQLIMCFKAKKLTVRLIPIFMIAAGYLFALLLAFDILELTDGFVDGDAFAAAIIAIGMSIAAVCDAIAWAVYGAVRKRKK